MAAENIIMMAYDDIANNKLNPLPGMLFNKPDPTGPGNDVYKGCQIDYHNTTVTPVNFLGVLRGNASGKVLRSTAEDNVFVFFSDHGAPGLIAFPHGELHKVELQAALAYMSEAKMFKKLVFYLETCESGSMFVGLKVPGVYAVSAANTKESSWGTYCTPADSKVNHTSLHTCLGDLFSVSWMQDSGAAQTGSETLEQQFLRVKTRTNKSHVMQWGDLSFSRDAVFDFIGNGAAASTQTEGFLTAALDGGDNQTAEADPLLSAVSAREVDLQRLYGVYQAVEVASPERLAASERLREELSAQQAAESAYQRFVALVFPGEEVRQKELWSAREAPDQPDCELAAHAALREGCASHFDANSGFALQLHQVVVNVCAFAAAGRLSTTASGVVALAAEACSLAPGAPAEPNTEIVV
jgi:hypothetical protein